MKKYIIYLLLLLSVILVFVGCNTNNGNANDKTNQSTESSQSTTHEHSIVIDEAVNATCTSTGLTKGEHCSDCGEIIVAQVTTEIVPHEMDSGVVIKSATCSDDGQIKYTCKSCSLEDVREIEKLNNHAYIYDEWIVDEQATCITAGSMSIHCANCDSKTQIAEISATGIHSYDESDEKCVFCHAPIEYTVGLTFEPINDGDEYEVYSIGSATGTILYIPKTYNDKPVTSIGEYAFESCTTLEYVYVPVGITAIGNNAFANCSSLKQISLPSTLKSIGNFAFRYTAIQDIDLPNSIKTIGNYAFQGSRLITIEFPASLETLGECVFNKCSDLKSITLPKCVTEIEGNAFTGCKLLETVILHDRITRIGESAFEYCQSLKNLDIPMSVTSIGRNAFSECELLLTKERGLTYVGAWLVKSDHELSSAKIKDGVIGIADGTFEGNYQMQSVTMPDSIKYIGMCAFKTCQSLESLTLPKNLISIGDYAFEGCQTIQEIIIPSTTTEIGYCSFDYMYNLEKLTIPVSVLEFDEGVFQNCQNLIEINYLGTKQQWESIIKKHYWNHNTGEYTIKCQDGNINKE